MSEKSHRILVVDDSEVSRAIVARQLSAAGFTVSEARDGVEGALAALAERPSLVVTDLSMPRLDGFPLLRLLKSDPRSADVPVLILTQHGEATSRFLHLRTGADAYLPKDCRPEQLTEAVWRLVERDGRSGPSPGAEPAKPGDLVSRQGAAVEVLARVARQLDESLLQATVTSTLLTRGTAAASFREACRLALETLAEVADARFLAVGFAEAETTFLHLLLAEPVPPSEVARVRQLLLASLASPAESLVELWVSGEMEERSATLPEILSLSFDTRGARGILALAPHDPWHFDRAIRPLFANLCGPLALVLDNARMAERLHDLSTLDGLTGQLNHRAIVDRLAEELSRAERYGQPLSIVLCDLDHFKEINDTFGHLSGDLALRRAAALLRRELRGADVLGRYGGEEFLAVLPQVGPEEARQAAERLRRALAEKPLALPSGPSLSVTGSFGTASTSELAAPEATGEALLSLADRRLYQAKTAGRNRVA